MNTINRKNNIKKGDPVKYKDDYYFITDIENVSNLVSKIELGPFKKTKKKGKKGMKINEENKIWISPNDIQVTLIDRKNHERLISYLRFLERYNTTIYYLNKKTKESFKCLYIKNVEKNMSEFFDKCKLKVTTLDNIAYTLKKTQNHSLEIENLIKDPFDFITENHQLITFDRAEKICDLFKLNIEFNKKCLAWSYHLFLKCENSFYIPKWKYLKYFDTFCKDRNKDKNIYLPYIERQIIDKKINDKVYKTTKYLLEKERDITDLVMELFYNKKYDFSDEEINEEIAKYEKENKKYKNFKFEKEQKEGIITSLKNKLSITTGPPGTGKTEIIRCIITALYNLSKKKYPDFNSSILEQTKFISPETISLIAPTGLAFINMKKGQEAAYYNDKISGTCHRTAYHTYEKIIKCKYECRCKIEDEDDDEDEEDDDEEDEYKKEDKTCKNNNNVKLIIIDETSMVDIFMFHEILEKCKDFNCRLILVGDVRQLPSIGPGTVLKSLIDSTYFGLTVLKTIKRQSAGTLVNNITKMSEDIILDKKCFKKNDKSMVFIDIESFILNKGVNKDLVIKVIDTYNLDINKNPDINFSKIITYFNNEKFTFNTTVLNNILQDKYNPDGDEIPSNSKFESKYTFRVQDVIVRTENDYSNSIMRANGDTARINSFEGNEVTITYDDGKLNPEKIGINELYENFLPNYSINIHKSQGSQYTNVVFFIEPNQTYCINKSAIYTAISRAKERCIIISNMEDFINCQKNIKSDEKKVSLFMIEANEYEL